MACLESSLDYVKVDLVKARVLEVAVVLLQKQISQSVQLLVLGHDFPLR